MIEAIFSTSENDRTIELRMDGHAGAGEYGKDIICASASILAYTLAQDILIARDREILSENPTVDLKGGKARISCKAKTDKDYLEMLHTLIVIQTGFKLLEHGYPQYVQVTTFGTDI